MTAFGVPEAESSRSQPALPPSGWSGGSPGLVAGAGRLVRRFHFAVALLALAAVGLIVWAREVASPPAVNQTSPASGRVLDAYGKLPLSFVPNAGQTDPRVRFQAQGAGFGFYFTDHMATFTLSNGKRATALDLRFVGASPAARLHAERRGTGTVNYLTGAASSRHTNLPTFHELTYRGLWPGIDMSFRGQGGRLKYEFRLSPGADPRNIQLTYAGVESLSLGRNGSLLMETPLGTLKDSAPRAYQLINGRRVPVESRFALHRAGGKRPGYGFRLGGYDDGRPLVIDPGLAYSTFLGGTSNEIADGIAVDGQGNAYVSGATQSTNFPTTPGAFDTTHGGNADAFVTKLNPSGTAVVYSTFLGGSGYDAAPGIAVDSTGQAYVTGGTQSANFPTTSGAFDETFNGVSDIFVAKLLPDGSGLSYSTFLGGTGSEGPSNEIGHKIALDSQNNAYVTGGTSSANFPTTPGAFDTSQNGDADAFVTKLDPTGASLTYSTFLGGAAFDRAYDIAVDGQDDPYVTGGTSSTDFPTTLGAFDTTYNGVRDVFVTRLDQTGATLTYSTLLGGIGHDLASGIALDGQDAFVTGRAISSDFPTTPGAYDTTYNGGGGGDAFVTKLGPSGSPAYSTFLGGAGGDGGGGIAVDDQGRAHVIGETDSAGYPTSANAYDQSLNGNIDSFVTKLNPAGTGLDFSSYLGGVDNDGIFEGDIALDSDGNAYVGGSTESADFPATSGAYDTVSNGAFDAFVAKLNLVPAPESAADDVGPGGSVSTGGNPTPDDPVETTVTSVPGGHIEIHETAIGQAPPPNFTFLGQQVEITAPGPLTIAFRIDASVLPPGADQNSVEIFKDGTRVENCTGLLQPDPCVSQRSAIGGGDIELKVVTSTASSWNFGIPDVAECADGQDNDSDTLTDSDDPQCSSPLDNSEAPDPSLPACSDLADNDVDGQVDFPNDQGCDSPGDVSEVGPPASLSLAPKTAVNPPGTQHCVTATVEDGDEIKVPGSVVRFAVSGTNSASGSDTTDGVGEASFCYTGSSQGDDTIDAYADTNGDSTKDPGEPSDSAAKEYRYGFLFGKGTRGSRLTKMSVNNKRASRYLLWFSDATVTGLRAYLDGNGSGTGSQTVRGVIYRDSGSLPSTLVAETDQVTINKGRPAGWVRFNLSSPLALSAGYYWLGLHSGANHAVARYGWDAKPNSRRYNIDGYSDGASSVFGSAFVDDQQIALHAIGYP